MTESEIVNIFEKTGAMLKGHFKLSSGLHSGHYLQCARVLQHPSHAEALCKILAKKFSAGGGSAFGGKNENPTAVIAPALGGIIVSYEVARELNAKSLFTERVDGKMTLRRGFELTKNDKVLVVEDVITTGLSTKEVIETVKSFGSYVVGVGCVVDRSLGGLDFGTQFKSVVKMNIPSFNQENCPLCAEKIPIIKPGSRK